MEGRSKQRNLDDFAAVSRWILQTKRRNLAKFSTGPSYKLHEWLSAPSQ